MKKNSPKFWSSNSACLESFLIIIIFEIQVLIYPQEDLDGLGAGGSCSTTGNILSDHSKGSIALSTATIVLSKSKHTHTIKNEY